MKLIRTAIGVVLTPIYYLGIGISSVCLLLGVGSRDCKKFWNDNK